jgi:hypothetical protein
MFVEFGKGNAKKGLQRPGTVFQNVLGFDKRSVDVTEIRRSPVSTITKIKI